MLHSTRLTIAVCLASLLGFIAPALAEPSVTVEAPLREIAISMDDAPLPGNVLFRKGRDRTAAIIQQLQAVNAPPVGIFALGVHAKELDGGIDRLKMYAKAGHVIANHSYSHYYLSRATAEIFIQDLKKAHEYFKDLPNFRPWFRFPSLHEGNRHKRNAVLKALSAMGYREGYVTVCNHDYRINQLVLRAAKQGKQIDYDKVRDIYLQILWDSITFADQMAHKVVGRGVKQVLMLHANDMAALFIGDLIKMIRSKGWKVISIEEAYQDPIADIPITTAAFAQSGRIAAIAKEKGMFAKGKGLGSLAPLQPSQEYDYIAQALEKAKAFTDITSSQSPASN